MMVEHVQKVLADPARVCPGYDPKQGYELAGFVWFQGFNDLVDGQTYPNGDYDEYSRLLAHFIRDVRKDLSAPKMPFVIGVLGVGGEGDNVNFRKAMAAPADLPEFQGNVLRWRLLRSGIATLKPQNPGRASTTKSSARLTH